MTTTEISDHDMRQIADRLGRLQGVVKASTRQQRRALDAAKREGGKDSWPDDLMHCPRHPDADYVLGDTVSVSAHPHSRAHCAECGLPLGHVPHTPGAAPSKAQAPRRAARPAQRTPVRTQYKALTGGYAGPVRLWAPNGADNLCFSTVRDFEQYRSSGHRRVKEFFAPGHRVERFPEYSKYKTACACEILGGATVCHCH